MAVTSMPRQRLYLGVVVALATIAVLAVARHGVAAPGTMLVFAAVAVAAEYASVGLPNGATASASMIPVMGAIYVLGAEGAYLAGGLVAAAGGFHLPDVRRRRFDRIAFNVAIFALAGLAAASVMQVVDPAGHPSVARLALATIPAAVAFLVVNMALLVPMLKIQTRRPTRELVAGFQPFHFQYGPFALIGAALGWLTVAGGLVVVPLAAAPIAVARHTFSSYLALKAAHEGTLRTLVRALERKDPYTAGHVERVAQFARYIGAELGLSEVRQERLRYAALMHDVGKLVVANHLLQKPDRLTADEYERVRLHEAVSVELLRRIDFLRPVAASASPRYARYDARAGSGDPIEPYIVVVADAYDAMTTTRPYRQALAQSVAFAELRRHSGTQFHPDCVDALIRALERREERHGYGYETDITSYDTPPPVRGPGSAGLGDLAVDAARSDADVRRRS